jgi:serine/threonine protein kinase/WD40 repeat protein/tetratricopeptide (TPR) repeat protein
VSTDKETGGTGGARKVHEIRTVAEGPEAESRGAAATRGVAEVAEFSRALIEIGLIDEKELEAFGVNLGEGVLGLSRRLIKVGKLTPYQAAAIYQKTSRGLLIGNYLILDKLGQGGMGVVFKATHRRLGRVGALKILPPSFARDQSAVMRFRREVEAAGRVKHPNLVAAVDADEDRGVHFLVMEYVDGRDLDRIVADRGPMPVNEAVDCMIQAARGLEAAHAQGIIHRDIKPGNLMLDASGTVRVLDLGLARIVDATNPFNKTAAGRLTQSGMYMGTIDYMAPEQAEDSHRVDHRADIYSLGCTLFYLLTGREPFPEATVLKRMVAHMERPAPSLRASRPDVPLGIESAYQKMMAKRPEDRPASMTEVIAYLQAARLLGNEVTAIAALPPKSKPELKVFNEIPLKHAGSPKTRGDTSNSTRRTEREGVRTEHELNLEDLAIDVRSEAPPLAQTARPFTRRSDLLRQPPLPRTLSKPSDKRLVWAATGTVAALCAVLLGFVVLRRPPTTHDDATAALQADTAADVSTNVADPSLTPRPDPEVRNAELRLDSGATRAGLTSSIPARGIRGAAKVPAPATEPYVEIARFVGHSAGFVERVRPLPDGKTLLTASQDKTVRLWDITTGRLTRRIVHSDFVRDAAVLPDGRRAVTACGDGYVHLWDLQTGKEIRRLVKHTPGPVLSLVVSPDGRTVVSGGEDGVLRLSDVERGGEIRQFDGQSSAPWRLALSPDGQRVISAGGDGIVRIGDVKRAGPIAALERRSSFGFGVAFSPDGRHAVSSTIGQITYWDLDTKRVVHQIELDRRHVAVLDFVDDRRVVFATHFKQENSAVLNEGVIGIWNVESNDPPLIVERGPAHIAMAILPRGGIATGGSDGIARIWTGSGSISRARELVAAGKRVEALIEYASAQSARPNDATLLIERGRLLAEMGRAKEADTDFTRAAQLAPDNPQLFLNAGWWVAGPYPPDLQTTAPVETEAVPDIAPPAAPAPTNTPRWQRAAIGTLGSLDLRQIVGADNAAAYAVAVVYSATSDDVVLIARAGDRMRVRLNGRQVLEVPKKTGDDFSYVPITLQPGRNSIVTKVVGEKDALRFEMRLSDAPSAFLNAHRFKSKHGAEASAAYMRLLEEEPSAVTADTHHIGGEAFAYLGRWKEALAAFKTARALNPGDDRVADHILSCSLALGDREAYQPVCRDKIAKFSKDRNADTRDGAIRTATYMRGALADYTEVLQVARKLLDDKSNAARYAATYGALLYRAKQYQDAAGFLHRSIEAQKGKAGTYCWVFLAMARHRLKLPTDKQAFDRAVELAKDPSLIWERRAEYQGLLEEAKRELAMNSRP